jgi:putative endonuclease
MNKAWMPGTSPGMTGVPVNDDFLAGLVKLPIAPGTNPSVMPGLGPGIHAFQRQGMSGGFVYIVTNRQNGTLYIGVTADMPRRAFEHREGRIDGFTKRYGLTRLVFVEHHADIRDAIQREKSLKRWPRARKVRLIETWNPDWSDLYDTLLI